MLLPQDFMKSMKKNHHLACNYLAFPHAQNGTYCGPHFLVESHTKILWHTSVKNAHHFLAPNIVVHTWIKILVHLTLEMMCISIYIVFNLIWSPGQSQTHYWTIFMWSILIWYFENIYGQNTNLDVYLSWHLSVHMQQKDAVHILGEFWISPRTHQYLCMCTSIIMFKLHG